MAPSAPAAAWRCGFEAWSFVIFDTFLECYLVRLSAACGLAGSPGGRGKPRLGRVAALRLLCAALPEHDELGCDLILVPAGLPASRAWSAPTSSA